MQGAMRAWPALLLCVVCSVAGAFAAESPLLDAFEDVFFVRTGQIQSTDAAPFQRVLGLLRRTGTPTTAAGLRNLTDHELLSLAMWSAAGRSAPYLFTRYGSIDLRI